MIDAHVHLWKYHRVKDTWINGKKNDHCRRNRQHNSFSFIRKIQSYNRTNHSYRWRLCPFGQGDQLKLEFEN